MLRFKVNNREILKIVQQTKNAIPLILHPKVYIYGHEMEKPLNYDRNCALLVPDYHPEHKLLYISSAHAHKLAHAQKW